MLNTNDYWDYIGCMVENYPDLLKNLPQPKTENGIEWKQEIVNRLEKIYDEYSDCDDFKFNLLQYINGYKDFITSVKKHMTNNRKMEVNFNIIDQREEI